MPTLSIIIVNYNVKSYLDQALRSIQKALKSISSEIIVVDNASSDGSVAMLRNQFPTVKCIHNKENVGFAKANNQALKIAKGDFYCLINPDTLVREDTFRACINYAENNPEIGMLGCKILNSDGSLQLACRRSIPTPWIAFTKVTGLSRLFPQSRIFGKYNLTYLDPDEEAEVEAVSGSFMFVREKAVKDVGGLDETFFMYGEDLDWCYRFIKNDWKIKYIPFTEIVHYKGRSTEEASFDGLRTFYKAMALFVEKHFKKGWTFFPRWFLLTGIWLRGAISFLSNLVLRSLVPAVDVLFIFMSFTIAIFSKFKDLSNWSSFGIVFVVYSIIWIICLAAMGLYRRGVFSFSKALFGVVLGLMINTSITFFFNQYAFSRYVVLAAGLLNIIFLGGWRILIRFAARLPGIPFLGRVGKTLARRRAVLVGTDAQTKEIIKRINTQIDGSYEIIGCLAMSEDAIEKADPELPVIGLLQDIRRISISHKIKDVIFTPENVSYEVILSTIAQSQNIDIEYKMIPQNRDVIIGKSSIDVLEDMPLVSLDYQILIGFNRSLKRLFDILLSGFLFFPSMIVLGVYLLNPRHKLQRKQVSDGYYGSLTIHEVCKNGKIVQGFLSVIPLLLPVLWGKLSFVGTEILSFQNQHGLGFKPGITGLAQINKKKNLDEDEIKKFTLYYLKNYTFLLDLEILIRTIF